MDFLVVLGTIAVGYWVIRSVLQPGVDLIDEGRKAAERLAEGVREAQRSVPGPGPRPGRQVIRGNTQDSRRSVAVRPGTRTVAPQREPSRHDWYFLLDVSPDAGKREIRDALKLRLARARAAGDTAAVKRLLEAAATGIRTPRRAEKPPKRVD